MSYILNSPTSSSGNVLIASTGASTSATTFTLPWNGTSASTWDVSHPVTISHKATVELNGKDADVIINGESLKDSIREIKEVLRIPGRLNRDTKLEDNWEELKAAAEHYEKLVQEYKKKQRVWDTLKDKSL